MPKLFTVKIEVEAVVLAENERDAEAVAEQSVRTNHWELYARDFHAEPMTYLPSEWEPHCYPHQNNTHGEKTVGEWLTLGAAPEYTRLRRFLPSTHGT